MPRWSPHFHWRRLVWTAPYAVKLFSIHTHFDGASFMFTESYITQVLRSTLLEMQQTVDQFEDCGEAFISWTNLKDHCAPQL